MNTLRPSQEKILEYTGGKMGISAVPGSGKTWTLSLLASELIRSGVLADNQEVLVVTLVNSAVDNFYQRMGHFIRKSGLIPNMGYRVRTLHGLAHDIVRERPGLVGLDEKFQIIDEREAESIRNEAARNWLDSHRDFFDQFIVEEMDSKRLDWVKQEQIPVLIRDIARSIIRSAKNFQITPEALRHRLDDLPVPLPLAEMSWEIYSDYQRALVYRGAVDFDDLIRLAYSALILDQRYLDRLRNQWPFILEDEAQDSSLLQEQILELLAGPEGNWVRVGDPNQAIFETFTTADPELLKAFLRRKDVTDRALPESGRSSQSIINLANHLVDWVQVDHPYADVRDALHGPPFIQPTSELDPQPNPRDDPSQVYLVTRKFSPREEILAVADSLERWLPEHPNDTVAVLVPRNLRGIELSKELDQRKLEYDDSLLQSSTSTRHTAGNLGVVLAYLAEPQSGRKLAKVYEFWVSINLIPGLEDRHIQTGSELLRKIEQTENYIWPTPERDWLNSIEKSGLEHALVESFEAFRLLIRRWQSATMLPIDQLVLSIAQDCFTDPVELALSYKLAVVLKTSNLVNPGWRLPELTHELEIIARNERRFIGFSQEDTGFDPDKYRGKVVLTTMHKAKGLEWDRVYLMSVNNYDFPSGTEGDSYLPEKWFIRGKMNLEAEALAQLDAIISSGEYSWYDEGAATIETRIDYIKERLRLLYVGITRAKKELILTYNSGRSGNMTPALAFVALRNYWNEQSPG